MINTGESKVLTLNVRPIQKPKIKPNTFSVIPNLTFS